MTREGLMQAGVDYDGGVRRFAGKAQLYEKYLLKFFDVDPFAGLQNKLDAGDLQAAFRIAHDLKGTSGTLCLGKLYETVNALVDCLRTGETQSAGSLCERAMELYREAEKAARV